METEYLKSLNPEQKQAVVHSGSPLLILAGAGSGKTRVITTKIAYLIQHEGLNPYNILAVTFTKKAAKEMQERAVQLEPMASYAQIRTFHSFGAWFLRKYASQANLEPGFTVYDDDDSIALLKEAAPWLNKKIVNAVAHDISLAKDYCLGPEDDVSDFDSTGFLAEAYAAYEKKLKSTGNADFGDLIMLPVKIIEQNPEIARQMHYRFKVIMVDEYQDSNVCQFRLLKALAGNPEETGTYVCVVGDDDQSIYKFRGAEVQNILRFSDEFPGTQLIKLERNYRSTSQILHAADVVIGKNHDRIGKTLVSERGEGSVPTLAFLDHGKSEAEYCSRLIWNSVHDKTNPAKYSDWAILYRTNAQSLNFETEFLHKKIPYTVVGSLKFFEREEVKDLIAWLDFLANPRNEIAFRRIINKPVRGIGPKTQDLIVQTASGTEENLIKDQSLLDTAKNLADSLSKKASEGLREFCSMAEGFIREFSDWEQDLSFDDDFDIPEDYEKVLSGDENSQTQENDSDGSGNSVPLSILIEKISVESGLVDYHKSQDSVQGSNKVGNLQELANSAEKYECSRKGLLQFLDTIELDRVLAEEAEDQIDAVTLITLHNTKGLEFNRVVITGLENGIFPREDKTGSELEEERRLFYVGITRAKNELYLTSCQSRTMYGRTSSMMPSLFLMEAGKIFKTFGKAPLCYRYLEQQSDSEGDDELISENAGVFAELSQKFKKGQKIYHDDYGYGQVISQDFSSGEFVIQIQFETGGKKTFLPQYQSRSLEIIKD